MMTSQYPLDLRPLREVAMDRYHLAMVAAPATLRISETTFWTLLTPSGRLLMVRKAAGNRNTRLPSSVRFALSDSLEHITYALTSEHTRTSDRSFARSAARHSLANTTANATKVCTLARRSLCVAALSRVAQTGAVVADSLAQMPWVVTSGRKLVGFALNPCWMKKLLRGKRPGSRNSSRHKLPLG
jgi:hypothetical protein